MNAKSLAKPRNLKQLEAPVRFKAVTWNVYFGTKVKELRPILRRLKKDGFTFLLMQEAGGDDITKMLMAEGYDTFVHGSNRLAWDRTVWRPLRCWGKILSDIKWVSPTQGEVITQAAVGRFEHIASGKKMKACGYQLPPHVQRPEWNADAPARFENTKDSIKTMVRMAKAATAVDFQLFGGDDNVDETGIGSWGFMTQTDPLVLVQAPKPTHGGGRRIDDFRVAGLVPVGRGTVRKGGGDHKLFGQEFETAA